MLLHLKSEDAYKAQEYISIITQDLECLYVRSYIYSLVDH